MTTVEAVAYIVYVMMRYGGITTAEAAEATGYTRQGVWRLLASASRVVPIWHDEAAGVWRMWGNEKSPGQ